MQITFHTIQTFVSEEEHLSASSTPEEGCRCEKCENVELLLHSVKKCLAKANYHDLAMASASDAIDFVENNVCSIKEFNCCNDVACTNCIKSTNIKEILQVLQGIDEITYSTWVRKNSFYQKVEFADSGTVVAETLDEITTKTFKLHVYNIFQQFSELKYLKKSLKNDKAILSVDFSRNYENKQTQNSKCLLWA